MLRRTLCALSAVAGLAAVPVANAHPPEYRGYPVHRGHVITGSVRVFYRGCAVEPWRVYAVYRNDREAHIAIRHLRARGFEVIVRGC